MGTNYMFRGATPLCRYENNTGVPTLGDHSDDPHYHIGKRSAAGLWCYDCNSTMYSGGVDTIHSHRGGFWYKSCQRCGMTKERDGNNIRGTCSFSWAMTREHFDFMIRDTKIEMVLRGEITEKVIQDEYGTLFTAEEMLELINECKIQFTDSIGSWFC